MAKIIYTDKTIGSKWKAIDANEVKTSVNDLYDAVDDKVDKVAGKGLSEEDYTTEEKNKLAVIANSITEYGAVGDNVTINNTAFVEAEASDYNSIYIPDGIFRYSGLTLNKLYYGPGSVVNDLDVSLDVKWFNDPFVPSGPVLSDYDSTIMYISHRGNALMYPENTMEAYDASYAAGERIFEPDVVTLSGGSLGVMHDNTVNRVTTSTGEVGLFDSVQWKALDIDANTWHGSNFGNDLEPPFFQEVLSRFKGNVIFTPEAKDITASSLMVDALIKAGIPSSQVIFQSFDFNALTAPMAAGYKVMKLTNGSTTDIAQAVSMGVHYAGIPSSDSSATITAWKNAGLKVIVFTVNKRYLRDLFISYGVDGFFSDDTKYLNDNIPVATRDTFASQRWMNGMVQEDAGNIDPAFRGKFSSPNYWGYDNTSVFKGVLQGWACPIKNNVNANSYNIFFSITFDLGTDETRWASIFISNTDKAYLDIPSGSSPAGYHFLARKNGQLDIYKVDSANALLATKTTGITAIANGQEAFFRLEVTPTAISLHRLTASEGAISYTVTSSDTTYRGGYFHLNRSQLACRFRNIVIT